MVEIYPRPDTLIDLLPKAIREAYYAVESSLMAADSVMMMIAGSRANLLLRPMGSLRALMQEHKAAVHAVEAELSTVRQCSAYRAMGQDYPTAHWAALDFCENIAWAVDKAANPKEVYLVDACGLDGQTPWVQATKEHLLRNDVIMVDGETTRPGPRWKAFLEKFCKLMPKAKTEDLQTHMRLELAAWAKIQKTNQVVERPLPQSTPCEEWLPAGKAVERAQRAKLSVNLSWLSRSAEKNGVKVRPRQLSGNHKREVEWHSLVGYLAKRKSAEATAEGDDDPSPSEQQKIENRKQKAAGKKRRERPTD